MRSFFAIPLPEHIRAVLARLRSDLGKVRWVPPAQLHVTLRFLGEIEEPAAERLIELVQVNKASNPWPALTLRARGVGVFGSPSRPRVLWTSIEPLDPVRAIALALDRAAVGAGIPPEERPFTAHVTLARFTRADGARVRAFLAEHASFATDVFEVPEVVLYRSTLGPRGATHDAIARFPLGGD